MVTSIKGNDTSTFGGQVVIPSPAFSAYLSANQSIATSTYTKLEIDTVDFDTSSDYDNTTDYRFTPSVAGYYQVTALASTSGLANATVHFINIYKNGSIFARGSRFANGATAGTQSVATKLIYMNGTTDYLEFYVFHNHGSSLNTIAGADFTYASAILVRAV